MNVNAEWYIEELSKEDRVRYERDLALFGNTFVKVTWDPITEKIEYEVISPYELNKEARDL